MQTAETLFAIYEGSLESRMTRKCPVRFGGGRREKDASGCPSLPSHHGLTNPGPRRTSPAAYPTGKPQAETFRWNPAGNQPRPAEPGQRPEASLAWCSGNRHCEA